MAKSKFKVGEKVMVLNSFKTYTNSKYMYNYPFFIKDFYEDWDGFIYILGETMENETMWQVHECWLEKYEYDR